MSFSFIRYIFTYSAFSSGNEFVTILLNSTSLNVKRMLAASLGSSKQGNTRRACVGCRFIARYDLQIKNDLRYFVLV